MVSMTLLFVRINERAENEFYMFCMSKHAKQHMKSVVVKNLCTIYMPAILQAGKIKVEIESYG